MKERSTTESEQLKSEFEHTRSDLKNVVIPAKMEKNMSEKSYIRPRGICLQKLLLLLILQQNQSFSVKYQL